jgi:3-dehydroquinate synthetase
VSPTPAGTGGSLVLTGMMGAGKTSTGRWIAAATGRRFVDTDDLVAERAGRPVETVFADGGEELFRALEAEAVRSLAGERELVVATGGLTMADESSRATLEALGRVVLLTARASTLARRLAGHPRPLLPAPSPGSVAELLAARRAFYGSFPLRVATDERTPAEVGRLVLGLAALPPFEAVHVAPDAGSYHALLGTGLLGRTGLLVEAALAPGRALVVTEPRAAALHLPALAAGLRSGPALALVPTGERAKNLATVRDLYHRMQAVAIDRTDVVIALGGGSVGDTAGFAAATYMRGLRLVHAPTTLLAMADSAIGGKTGVDFGPAKNMVGAFHDPVLVVADTAALATLPAPTLAEGMSEIVKAGLVGDASLFADLELHRGEGLLAIATDALPRALAVKADRVARDPRDEDVRAQLNLGHTFAHALETASGFQLGHGRAVAVGLVAACRLGELVAGTPAELGDRVARVLDSCGLPTSTGLRPEAVLGAMAADKKRKRGALRFVLPLAPGNVTLVEGVSDKLVLRALQSVSEGV